jgi:hypothetical protein
MGSAVGGIHLTRGYVGGIILVVVTTPERPIHLLRGTLMAASARRASEEPRPIVEKRQTLFTREGEVNTLNPEPLTVQGSSPCLLLRTGFLMNTFSGPRKASACRARRATSFALSFYNPTPPPIYFCQ